MLHTPITGETGRAMFPTIAQIAKEEGRESAVISKAITSAFVDKLVEIKEIDAMHQIVIDEYLTKEIRRTFPTIRTVRVVKCPIPTAPDEFDLPDGKSIHLSVGRALAKDIVDGAIVEPQGRVAFGGGRAVFYFLEALRRFPPVHLPNSRVIALAGIIKSRPLSSEFENPLDPDFHAQLFRICLEGDGIRLDLVRKPIAHGMLDNPSRWKAEKLEDTPIATKNWHGDGIPTLAITGIGAFSPGHRFYDAAEVNNWSGLEPMQQHISRLRKICQPIMANRPDYCPVGDIGFAMFFVPPPNGFKLDSVMEASLQKAIEEINDQTLTVSWEQLSKINNVTIITSSKIKARAVAEVIQNRAARSGDIKVHGLYIDQELAKELIRIRERP